MVGPVPFSPQGYPRLFPSVFSIGPVRRFFLTIFLLSAFVVLGAGAAGLWWVQQPLKLPAPTVDLSVEPGTTPRGIAQAVADTGTDVSPQLLYWWFRFSGQDRQIRAGQVRSALAKAEQLKPETFGLSDEELMARLGKPGLHPEGRFFPDTYTYSKGSTDIALLQRAMRAMDKKLDAAWAARASDVPLRSADEALILASIVEKETGKAQDRSQIAAVFVNRLRVGMPLQTDPTVIYGMGTRFDGNLRKKDLQADTPWNTYTRPGLPPTPIAMPGKAALLAAVQPAQSRSLYFVSKGDGSSHFSSSLEEHNRAVNRYQRSGQ
jgi:UPF0755 protein